MRRSLVASYMGVALVAVLALGVPLGFLAARVVRDGAETDRQRDAERVAASVDDDIEHHRPVTASKLTALAGQGRRVVLTVPGGRPVIGGSAREGKTDIATARSADGARITLVVARDETDERVTSIFFIVGGLAIAGLGAAAVLGSWQSRRFARPLERLADAVDAEGGAPAASQPGVGEFPEIAALAHALDRGAERVADALERERSFSANVSHQLRTPLTALDLRLEALAAADDPAVRAEAEAALEQSDRIERTIESQLELARHGQPGSAVDLDVGRLATERAAEWAERFAAVGREIRVSGGPLVAPATRAGLEQVLDVLLDNALRHGAGAVVIEVGATGLAVSDEGPGIQPGGEEAVFVRGASGGGGHGLGLALARSLVEADGGRLVLRQPRPPTFAVVFAPA